MVMRSICYAVLSALCLLPSASFAQADSQVTPTALAFPITGIGSTSTAQTVVLNNYSAAAFVLNTVAVTGPFTVNSSNCPITVAGGGQCYLYVKASPTTAGAFTGTMTLTTSGGTYTLR